MREGRKGEELRRREGKGGEERRVLNYFCLVQLSVGEAGMERIHCMLVEYT